MDRSSISSNSSDKFVGLDLSAVPTLIAKFQHTHGFSINVNRSIAQFIFRHLSQDQADVSSHRSVEAKSVIFVISDAHGTAKVFGGSHRMRYQIKNKYNKASYFMTSCENG